MVVIERSTIRAYPDIAVGRLFPSEDVGLLDSIPFEHCGISYTVVRLSDDLDYATTVHQRRVADLARKIAAEMRLTDLQVKAIYVAGLLHDLGKLVVPVKILLKPGKISRQEFNLIRRHSLFGHAVLVGLGFPQSITEAVLQHHERPDASGYPFGLAGNKIFLGARIIAVADVIDAMSSYRVYRPAPGLDQALNEVWQNRGKRYDPEVAAICLRLLQDRSAAESPASHARP